MSSAPTVRMIPERWEQYLPLGTRVPGTRIVCFKVPISEKLCKECLPNRKDWFTPADLVKILAARGEHLGLIINLSPAESCYDPQELSELGIVHQAISGSGKGIPSSKTVRKFVEIIKEFERLSTDKESLIGVHCTNGINRTGYVVCRYLRDKCGRNASEAVEVFNLARGHPIERTNYVEALTVDDGERKVADTKTEETDSTTQGSSKEKRRRKEKKRKEKKEHRGSSSKKLKRRKDRVDVAISGNPPQNAAERVPVKSESGESQEQKVGTRGVIHAFNPVKELATSAASSLPPVGIRHLRMTNDERIDTVSPFQSATISSTADIVPEAGPSSSGASLLEEARISPGFVPIPPAVDDEINTSVAVKLLVAESGAAKVLTAEELEDLEDGEVRSDEDEEAVKLREQKRKLRKIRAAAPTVKLDEKEKSKNLLYNKMFSQIRTKKMPIGIVIKSTSFAGASDNPPSPAVELAAAAVAVDGVAKVTEEPTSTTGDAEMVDDITPNVTGPAEIGGPSLDPSPIFYAGAYVPAQPAPPKPESGRVYRDVRPLLRAVPVGSSTPITSDLPPRKQNEPKLPWEIDEPDMYPYGPPSSAHPYSSAPIISGPPVFNVPPPTRRGGALPSSSHYPGSHPVPLMAGPNYRGGGGLDPSFERFVPPSIRGFEGRSEARREPGRRGEQQLSGGNAQPLPQQHRVSHGQHVPPATHEAPPPQPTKQQFNPNPPANNNALGTLVSLLSQVQSAAAHIPPAANPPPNQETPGPSQLAPHQPAIGGIDPNNPMMAMLMQTFLLTACQQMTAAAAPPPVVAQPAQPQMDPMTTLLMTAMLGMAANATPMQHQPLQQQLPQPSADRPDFHFQQSQQPSQHHHSRKRHSDGASGHHQYGGGTSHSAHQHDQKSLKPLMSEEMYHDSPHHMHPTKALVEHPQSRVHPPPRPVSSEKMESSEEEGLAEDDESVEMPSEKEEGEASDSSGTKQKSQTARRRDRRRKLGGKFATMRKGKFWQIYDMQYSKT